MKILTTNRILLQEIKPSDIKYIYAGLSNPKVIEYYGVSFETLEDTKKQMKWYKDPKQKWFTISSIDKKIFYGATGLNDISEEHKKAEIGLWLLPEYWGNGLMTEAIPLICEYGFTALGLHRIEGFVDSENINCKKSMSKLDFKFEGTMKDCEIKNNRFVSVDIYAKLNTIN
jgi:ribosomal-protein-alanine N-acetyltransferase